MVIGFDSYKPKHSSGRDKSMYNRNVINIFNMELAEIPSFKFFYWIKELEIIINNYDEDIKRISCFSQAAEMDFQCLPDPEL